MAFGDIAKIAGSIASMTSGQDQRLAQTFGMPIAEIGKLLDDVAGKGPAAVNQLLPAIQKAQSGKGIRPCSPAQSAKLLAPLVTLNTLQRQMEDIEEQIDDLLKEAHKPVSTQSIDALMQRAISDMTSDHVATQQQAQKNIAETQLLMQAMSQMLKAQNGMMKNVVSNVGR